MRQYSLLLPKLDLLKPNKETTFYKLVEEVSETISALDDFNIEMNYKEEKIKMYLALSELVDILQVCSSQLFIFEEELLQNKIFQKFKESIKYEYKVIDKSRVIKIVEPDIKTSISSEMKGIIKCVGSLAQLSKYIGANGEKQIYSKEKFYSEYIKYINKIMGNCCNIISIFMQDYGANMNKVQDNHISKLKIRKYVS